MTYRLLVAYDGTDFCGWQRQREQPTVQQALEEALATCLRQPVGLTGAGRTDSGVHARGQVAHFNFPEVLDREDVLRSLNGLTPHSIAIKALSPVAEGFHARFDAIRRRYRYQVACLPTALERHYRYALSHSVDFDLMNEAASLLVGQHDYDAFCLTRSPTRNRQCTVHRASWRADVQPGHWYFEIEANRFLHGMVRAIVGTLLEVGRGKREVEDILAVLGSRDRRAAGPAAPAHGLVLESVHYA